MGQELILVGGDRYHKNEIKQNNKFQSTSHIEEELVCAVCFSVMCMYEYTRLPCNMYSLPWVKVDLKKDMKANFGGFCTSLVKKYLNSGNLYQVFLFNSK